MNQQKGVLLCLHGFLGQPADWKPVWQCAPLPSWRIRSVNLWNDLRLSGRSRERWLDDFAERFLGARPLVLCGYSLGARLAMTIACRQPDLVSGLVIVSGHPGLRTKRARLARLRTDRQWAKVFADEPWAKAIARWNRQPVFTDRLRKVPKPIPRANLLAALDLFSLGRQPNLRSPLQKLHFPMMWVVGEKDRKFSALADEKWLDQSSIAVRKISDCGHRVLQEDPRALAGLLQQFLPKVVK